MLRKITQITGIIALIAALAVPGSALAAARPSNVTAGYTSIKTNIARPAGLIEHGCDPIWNLYFGQYAKIAYTGEYPLTFEPAADLSYLPNFCNLQVTNVNGAFEIMDPNDPNNASDPTEWGCLSVDASNGTVRDDTPSACWAQNYSWDQWYAINTGNTYHSGTLWEFENRYNDECLAASGSGATSVYSDCNGDEGDNVDTMWFIWNGSGL